MDPSTFAKLAGDDGRLDSAEIKRIVEGDMPDSRKRLNPRVVDYADLTDDHV